MEECCIVYNEKHMVSFLQTSAWATFQEKLGRKTSSAKGDGWSFIGIHESGVLNTRLYTPYGPECSTLEEFDEAISELKKIARQEGMTFIRVDPPVAVTPSQLRGRGFYKMSYQQLQPAHTQVIDLSQSTDDLLAQMSQNSRNITRNYKNKGVTIRTSRRHEDITILTSLLSKVARRNHISPHSKHYFQTQVETLFPLDKATLYIAEYEDAPIAAALIYDSDDTRTYAHAATDDTYRKLSAGTALVGQMILDAKEAGLTYFDLYGIADTDDPSHPWAGFTRFKKSFGGYPVTRPGTWDLPINKPGYWLYRLYQSIYRKLRRRS